MELTCKNVHEVAMACLFDNADLIDGKPPEDRLVIGDAIVNKLGFDKERIALRREDIRSMLSDLPDQFKEGASFLSACYTKRGVHWGEHRDMGKLFALGQAAGYVKSCFPRDMWSVLPGGMPYYIVRTESTDPAPSGAFSH